MDSSIGAVGTRLDLSTGRMLHEALIVPRPGMGGPVRSPLDPSTGVYSQSSVYISNEPATVAAMTSPTVISSKQTATDANTPAWIQIDYGSVRPMDIVKVRAVNSDLDGGWGVNGYLGGCFIELSDNGTTWRNVGILSVPNVALATPVSNMVTVISPGVFVDAVLPKDTQARYVRLFFASGYIATTGFYAETL